MWAGNVSLLFRCLVSKESEQEKLVLVPCIKCEPLLEEVNKALKVMRLQWVNAS